MQLDELLEAAADLSSGHYKNVVTLEEEVLDGSGALSVGIELQAVRDSSLAPPSFPIAFVMHLEVGEGSSSVMAKAIAEMRRGGRGLCVRCAGVEQPLQGSVRHLLVMVASWGEVPQALEELGACVQVPLEASPEEDVMELPLDLSALCAAAAGEGGTDRVEAKVHSEAFPSLGQGLQFNAVVESLRWEGLRGQQPGRSKDAELWASMGASIHPRAWRCSVEVRSIRLTTRSANVFAMYTFGPFRQPRAFRTNPPTVARKNTTVSLPHSFAAYTMLVAEAELREQLEEPLRLEVWHRDLYKKDGPIGFVDVSLAAVFEQPLQHSDSMSSMIQGFRVLDQVCSMISTADSEGGKIGAVRLLIFLEDLGLSVSGLTDVATPLEEPLRATGMARPSTAPPGETASAPQAESPPAASSAQQARGEAAIAAGAAATEAAPMVEQATPGDTGRATAYQLEIWRRTEEEKFRAYLAEQDATMRSRLEEKYRQREVSRATEFQQTQSELRGVEAKVRRRLQELQQREVALAAEEARLAVQWGEARKQTEKAIRLGEDKSRQKVSEARHTMDVAQSRNRNLEARIEELSADLATTRNRVKDMESDLQQSIRSFEDAPAVKTQRELGEVMVQLREQQSRTATIAASRDHFRRKVEELCERFPRRQQLPLAMVGPDALADNSSSARPRAVVEHTSALDATHAADLTEVAKSLRRFQSDLAQLAKDWTAEPPVREAAGALPVEEASAKPSPTASRHLAWLRSERQEMLDSGLYSVGDAVLQALDARIAEAMAQR